MRHMYFMPALLVLLTACGTTTPAPVAMMTAPAPIADARTDGTIFTGHFAPLTSGRRGHAPGDLVTVILTERASSTKQSATTTNRDGTTGMTPPALGPLGLVPEAALNFGSEQSFKGGGQANQSMQLFGEITVTVTAVDAHGTLSIAGTKTVMMARGPETLTLSGRIRSSDIDADNRIASPRIADARIGYTGKGVVNDAARPGWLARVFAIVSPF